VGGVEDVAMDDVQLRLHGREHGQCGADLQLPGRGQLRGRDRGQLGVTLGGAHVPDDHNLVQIVLTVQVADDQPKLRHFKSNTPLAFSDQPWRVASVSSSLAIR
jgi:hypothetical protein